MHEIPSPPQAFFDEFGVNADDRVWDYGRACYALALSRGVPADMVLVPREMPDALAESREYVDGEFSRSNYETIYRLLAAAPAPAAAGAQGEVPQRAEFDYVDIANRVQHATGKSVFPSTVKAILTAAGSITPQPAAADGGVRELPAMTPERCAFFLRRFKNDEKMLGPNEQLALDYAIAALSSHRQAGDAVAVVHCDSFGTARMIWNKECTRDNRPAHGTKLYTALPPGADLSKFRELAEKWRGEDARKHSAPGDKSDCADELLALVEKGGGNG